MKKALEYLLLAAALAVAGCSDDAKKPTPDASVNPDGGGASNPDGGAGTPDGGGASNPDGATTQTLVQFVNDVIKNKTNETATPESIDDKTLSDTSDPAAFDSLF